ncbi:N-acetyltransferase [Psychromonas marina]|uniref:N-acetyltransferase n=1 Tax=Psychromonas marina TaxID=88364 RepID=A0ABQ6E4B8_9GAMM|nr:GNAT family N-acetyltransferase [Psychromonas marina]GLS92045.1 N-acetyltransferase [Psychromonas marina]
MIETQRLILKPVSLADFDIYKAIMSCPIMSLYLPKAAVYSDQEISEHLIKRVNHWQHGFGSYIVSLKSQPEVKLGYAGVEISPNVACSDIRYGLIADAQGKGFAYEAAQAVLSHTFSLGKHTKIYGVAVKDNLPSVSILEKLGLEVDRSAVIYDDPKLVTLSINKSSLNSAR